MFGWIANRNRERIVERVYAEIVAQARQPAFYEQSGVPDTMEGRYEMMVLHVFLLLNRLRDADEKARDAAQAVCDHFFLEMDRAMREMGVGDLTVPKKMKKIAALYASRSQTYGDALSGEVDSRLAKALAKAIFDDETKLDAGEALATYVRTSVTTLASREPMDLIERAVVFADPMVAAGAR